MDESGFDRNRPEQSKFEVVNEVASRFIMKRRNDHIGVVYFGDFAYVASPLSYEKRFLAEFLALQSQGLAGRNTAIGEGINQSLEVLKHSKAETKIVILLTDGRSNHGRVSVEMAVERAIKEGVRIYGIGIGSESDIDHELLKLITEKSGGAFFFASHQEALSDVYHEIDTLTPSTLDAREYEAKAHHGDIPLLGAVMVLVGLLILNRRRVWVLKNL